MRACLAFSLLDTPVRVRSASAEVLTRLSACYGIAPTSAAPSTVGIAAALEPAPDGFAIAVPGRPARRAPDLVTAVRAFNHELMHAVMAAHPHLLFVHAGVVAIDGRAVVLPGLSRAGKSTLVLAMLHAGATLLSDELLAYDPATRRLLPFPRAVKVRDECIAYFPDYQRHFVGTGEGRFLPSAALGEHGLAAAATAGVLAAPCWDAAGDDTPQPITAGEGLLHLARSALNFGARREQSVDDLAALAGASTCYALTWREPHAAARALLHCVERGRP